MGAGIPGNDEAAVNIQVHSYGPSSFMVEE